MEVFAVRAAIRYARDCSGGSSVDYIIILAGLCLALFVAGVFLDANTQAQLQAYVSGLLGMQ